MDHYYHHPLSPPLISASYQEVVNMHHREINALVQKFALVVVLLYDIVDEPSRTDSTTTLTPRPRHDSVDYLRHLRHALSSVQVKWCLFHAIRPDDTLDTLSAWYSEHHVLFDSLVITGNHWNLLKVERVYPVLRALRLPRQELGAVLIPHRAHEMERCVRRKECGVDFFVTQLQLYPTPEWREFVRILGPSMITLTTAPTTQKQLDFLETLGVQTQGYRGIEDPLEEKVRRVLEFVSGQPFGFEILPESKTLRTRVLEMLF